MGQVAIFGGTFDPIHWGHLIVAETALSQLNLDRVIWVPTNHPPHKRGLIYEHRRLMVEKAIADHGQFSLAPIDATQTGTDYAVKTLAHLQDIYPNQHWYWIIGADAFQTLPQWYGREKLIPACKWIVAPRLGVMPATPDRPKLDHEAIACLEVVKQLIEQNIPIRCQRLHMPQVGISSSLIREYYQRGWSIRYLVPEAVRTYITTHNLYRIASQPHPGA